MTRATRGAKVPLLLRAQMALGMTQREIGELLRVSSRTIIRWRGATPPWLTTDDVRRLAAAVDAVDRELADEIAKRYGTTLEELGVVVPALPPPPPPASPPRPLADVGHLVDSIVCAAAEAMATTPQTVRPALAAAFERAGALRLEVEAVRAALRPEKTSDGAR